MLLDTSSVTERKNLADFLKTGTDRCSRFDADSLQRSQDYRARSQNLPRRQAPLVYSSSPVQRFE